MIKVKNSGKPLDFWDLSELSVLSGIWYLYLGFIDTKSGIWNPDIPDCRPLHYTMLRKCRHIKGEFAQQIVHQNGLYNPGDSAETLGDKIFLCLRHSATLRETVDGVKRRINQLIAMFGLKI